MKYNGYDYTIHQDKYIKTEGVYRKYYRCKSHRKKCMGKLWIDNDIIREFPAELHTCKMTADQAIDGGSVLNATDEIRVWISSMALENMKMTSLEIAAAIILKCETVYSGVPYQGFSKQRIAALALEYRRSEHGSWESAIRSHPLASVSMEDPRLFLRLFKEVSLPKINKLSRMIGFGHPDLLFELRTGPYNLFLDCTFHCVPRGFTQLMIVMAYLSAYDRYVPMFHVLLQGKQQELYVHALYEYLASTGWAAQACKTTTCDYEPGLINALKSQFPEGYNGPFVGCW